MVDLKWLLVLVVLFIAGCSAPEFSCQAPNVVIGNSCCLDADSDGSCDSRVLEEPSRPVVEPSVEITVESSISPEEEFARTFEATWNKKNYNALYYMFSDNIQRKFSQKEFNFLMKRADAKAGILLVSFKDASSSAVDYIVTADEKVRVSGELSTKDGKLVHEPFYIFEDADVEEICDEDQCFVDYAKLTGVRSYCEFAGDLRADCLEYFGTDRGILGKIDECAKIKDTYGKNDCLTDLAVKEKSIEPCWENDYDKQIFECMGEVAAIDDNATLCRGYVDSRSSKGTRLQHAYCIMGYVRVTSDNKACLLIDRRDDVVLGAMVENCDRLKFV